MAQTGWMDGPPLALSTAAPIADIALPRKSLVCGRAGQLPSGTLDGAYGEGTHGGAYQAYRMWCANKGCVPAEPGDFADAFASLVKEADSVAQHPTIRRLTQLCRHQLLSIARDIPLGDFAVRSRSETPLPDYASPSGLCHKALKSLCDSQD